MRLSTARLTVHTRYPFRIARPGGSVDERDVHRVVLRLEHDGTVGFGEAAPTPYYGQTPDSVEETVAEISRLSELLGDDAFAIGPIVRRLVEAFDDQLATVAAVDAALHDWVGKRLGVPVWKLLGLDPSAAAQTSMTIGLDDPETLARKVADARGCGVLKIKVGTECDVETLEVVRRHAPDKTLRLDANAAWSPNAALDAIRALARFDPELIEQPIPAGHLAALRDLHRRSPMPVYVDEDCVRPADLPRLAGCVTGVNIKLAKCGGIRQALCCIERARTFDLKVMLGCMAETSLGVSAAAQLASLADLVDLDGHLLLEDDPFDALRLDGDRVLPRDRPGLGADASELFA